VSGAVVCALAVTAVKGSRLCPVKRVQLDRHGVRENRRFYLIDERDRMVNAKRIGALHTLISRYQDGARWLEIEFPDGHLLSGRVELGPAVQTRFFSRQARARLVLGDWSQAISRHVGEELRLVEADERGAVDRGARGPVTVISTASLRRLAGEAGRDTVDARRFRMLIEVDGVPAHTEDTWLGRRVSVGQAVIRPRGHVGRCLVTSRDPESGEIDLPTLDILDGYRRDSGTTEPLAFGVYGEVLAPGTIQVGDPVMLEDG
jgi:uncharacterized protein YcbX